MKLVQATDAHLAVLKTWFPNRQSARDWAGPDISYPFTGETFLKEIHWLRMPACSLLDEGNQLAGFGQYYEKLQRCHLARLVIAPERRSKGLGRHFIGELMRTGMLDLQVNECSLFVIRSNETAKKCYTSLGFVRAEYPPEPRFLKNAEFMVFKPA